VTSPHARGLLFGDRVEVSMGPNLVTPARVVAVLPGNSSVPCRVGPTMPRVVVATHLPMMVLPPGVRVLPIGTAAYVSFSVEEVSLVRPDPTWNPHLSPPQHTPEAVRVISGEPHWRIPSEGYDSITHVGAYIPSTWYPRRVLAWAWEGEWREAYVDGTSRGWIRLGLTGGVGRFPSIKAFRPFHVSPVLCPESAIPLRVDWKQSLWPGYEHYEELVASVHEELD
jgi:hypothetical protein